MGLISSCICQSRLNVQDEYGNTVLHKTVADGIWTLVPILVQFGADVNLCNRWNETPLHWAADNGAPAYTIRRLISPHNINMQNVYGDTALRNALRWERQRRTCFPEEDWAMRNKQLKNVPVLLQHGADVNLVDGREWTPLHVAVYYDAPEDIVTQLISPHNINMQDNDGDTAFHKALKQRRWHLVPVLQQQGADVNLGGKRNLTPLHEAVYHHAPADIVARLISPHNINMQDTFGDTALHVVVKGKGWELVPVLLQHGADVNMVNHDKETQLHCAADHGAPANIINQLISPQNINRQDRYRSTALRVVVRKKRWELVPILLQHGADPSMLDFSQREEPLLHSLKALCIATIRSHMPAKTDEAYNGLGLPGKLVDEAKLKPVAENIVNRGQSE